MDNERTGMFSDERICLTILKLSLINWLTDTHTHTHTHTLTYTHIHTLTHKHTPMYNLNFIYPNINYQVGCLYYRLVQNNKLSIRLFPTLFMLQQECRLQADPDNTRMFTADTHTHTSAYCTLLSLDKSREIIEKTLPKNDD